MLTKAYIPYGGYYSTPFVRWQGSLASENAIALGAATSKRFLEAKKWDPNMLDYVHVGSVQPSRGESGASRIFGFEPRIPNQNLPRNSCHGPHCRQQSPTPSVPIPTTGSPQQKACLAGQSVPMLHLSLAGIPQAAVRHGELLESRIERPPRRCS